jgi:hypothetical protein
MTRRIALGLFVCALTARAMDLTKATVVTREPGKPAQVLAEEVEKRTGVRWTQAPRGRGSGRGVADAEISGPAIMRLV